MEIRVLKYFLTVAREESITRAAEVLHITQPTLSRQIAQLESEVGVQLFERGTRKLHLTNEGMLLRRRAEEIIELVDKAEQELKTQDEAIEGLVSIGCGDLTSVQILSDMIRGFREKYPAVTFDLHTATADHITDRMEHGLTDIGLLLEPVDMEEFEFIRLPEKEQWVVTMRPDSPLTQKESVTAEDLLEVPVILPNRQNIRSEVANWFGDDYGKLQVAFTSNLPSTSSVLVNHGMACALTIRGSIAFWDENHIICKPLYPELSTSCVLAWKRQQPFGPAATKFIAYVKEYIRGLNET